MKKIVMGILAHVDAGKTTLSEALLFNSGAIRKHGRVDNGDAFLDTYDIERERGITVFSKQAQFTYDDVEVTLVDTPGHVDFSAEMERTLSVLDYGILVVSGTDGVQSHTITLWKLLKMHHIPTIVFVNKIDRMEMSEKDIILQLQNTLKGGFVDFTHEGDALYDQIAMCNEICMNEYLDKGFVSDENIALAIRNEQLIPCYFGSALKLTGIDGLLAGIGRYCPEPVRGSEFGAIIYKILKDESDERLTFMKITGGSLRVKTTLTTGDGEEKADMIRIYSGSKYTVVNEAVAGTICAVTGLKNTMAGQVLGCEKKISDYVIEPVICYSVILPEKANAVNVYGQLLEIGQEIPELSVSWDEISQNIQVKVMGQIQAEVFIRIVKKRLGIDISLGAGNIVYKETIASTAYGVGHFEPLRHYAEVHLMLEPDERGAGLSFYSDCTEDELALNWQRLILTHLGEKKHKGVLLGAPVTDMKITLIAGGASKKHTQGGDFRQAVYRAVRNGLMQAESVILEPFYKFRIEVPMENVGRVLSDINKMNGKFNPPDNIDGKSIVTGRAPVEQIMDYANEIKSYTHGNGFISLVPDGYDVCHNPDEVISRTAYNPEADLSNTPDSVFCAGGAGFVVPWYEVYDYMHIKPDGIDETPEIPESTKMPKLMDTLDEALGTEEIDQIIFSINGANKKKKSPMHTGMYKKIHTREYPMAKNFRAPVQSGEKYLLVDGYNVVFAWKELNDIAKDNIDGARDALLEIMCNYQAAHKINLIVVFDAYRVKGHDTEFTDYKNIHVVYTKEAETADRYIERFAHKNSGKYDITIVTSDGLEQIIIRGAGCKLISSREFEKEVLESNENIKTTYEKQNQDNNKSYIGELFKDKKSIDNF